MSQHPRLAGDGRLTLPAKVAFDDQGFIRGRFSAQDVDPFEPTADKLLLAESFARLELDDRAAWKAWIVRHGALDPYDLFDGDGALPDDGEWAEDRPEGAFAESRDEWAREQANVRWHLSVLERLSDARETRVWEPAWGAFVLDAEAALDRSGDVGLDEPPLDLEHRGPSPAEPRHIGERVEVSARAHPGAEPEVPAGLSHQDARPRGRLRPHEPLGGRIAVPGAGVRVALDEFERLVPLTPSMRQRRVRLRKAARSGPLTRESCRSMGSTSSSTGSRWP